MLWRQQRNSTYGCRDYDSIHQPHEGKARTNLGMERRYEHEISLLAVELLAIEVDSVFFNSVIPG